MNPKFIIEIENIDTFTKVDFSDKTKLPKAQGLYMLADNTGIVYVGSTSNLYNRILSHQVPRTHYKNIICIYFKLFEDNQELLIQERLYLYYYFKKFNNSQTIAYKFPEDIFGR